MDGLDFNTDYRSKLNHYCLDGVPLLPTSSATNGTVNFTAERTSFARITAVYQDEGSTAVGGDPLYFSIRTKDGQTVEYGALNDTNHSRAESYRWLRSAKDAIVPGAYPPTPIAKSSKKVVYGWYVSRIIDLFGNTMNFRYRDDGTSERLIEEITYGGALSGTKRCSSATRCLAASATTLRRHLPMRGGYQWYRQHRQHRHRCDGKRRHWQYR